MVAPPPPPGLVMACARFMFASAAPCIVPNRLLTSRRFLFTTLQHVVVYVVYSTAKYSIAPLNVFHTQWVFSEESVQKHREHLAAHGLEELGSRGGYQGSWVALFGMVCQEHFRVPGPSEGYTENVPGTSTFARSLLPPREPSLKNPTASAS